ncbi:MAG: bifunctional 4-hydroxy-2-oxoglutarate aldolase/2-dehydro-3-deoxy-phosphogluconate aldolase [Rhodobacteraceae bacterium]|nr:bifunctional 4-hydroxy-2-oxoglutarate aldolase/2-dehydro-3-deoxy-phosphogluconate aldolase [Paracoccaceae bacterium]
MTRAIAQNKTRPTPSMHMLCHQAPVIPVLVIKDLAHAVPLAEALVAGGLPVLEVTLRSAVALQAISLMVRVPGATIGAGTVLTSKHAREAQQAGATFAVSPGATPPVIDCCEDLSLPLLPGAASATEVMHLLDRGFDLMKFFPAAAAGGLAALRAFDAPLPQVHFCPAGGLSQENARDYLALANVACVAGSWVAPAQMILEERWGEIRQLAHQARQLGNHRAGRRSV